MKVITVIGVVVDIPETLYEQNKNIYTPVEETKKETVIETIKKVITSKDTKKK